MKRVLSGIKPSGELTLGNYLGAMKRWVEVQNTQQAEFFYFVPNLHALTTRPDAKALATSSLSAVAWLLAMGIDYRKSVIFLQSQIPEHSELCWILNNYVTMGELSRMTQFKDKSSKADAAGQLVGLFNYPVLMAADILLYDADEVPVGEDQRQHVELTRAIARRFNEAHGPVFKLPKGTIQEVGAKIMNLKDPLRKMDKSDPDQSGVILLSDKPEAVKQKITRAVTDSGTDLKAAPDRPAITNLLNIYSLLSGDDGSEVESNYRDKGYHEFKQDLAELAVSVLEPLLHKQDQLLSDRDQLISIVEDGKERAAQLAERKLVEVKSKLGLL